MQTIKHLSINPEETTLVSFDVRDLFTSIPVPAEIQVINSKISTSTNFTNVCKIPTETFIKFLEFTTFNCIFCFHKKFYKQLQCAAMGSYVSPVIANIYLEHFEYLAISVLPTLIKFYVKWHVNFTGPHIKLIIKLPGTDGLSFLDTLNKPTPNSIESTVYRKPTPTDRYLDYNFTTQSQQNYLLSTPSSTELNKYVLYLNSLQKKWITFTKSYKTTTTQHSSFNKPNPNRKADPSTGKFTDGTKVVIPYIKGLSEQYRCALNLKLIKTLSCNHSNYSS